MHCLVSHMRTTTQIQATTQHKRLNQFAPVRRRRHASVHPVTTSPKERRLELLERGVALRRPDRRRRLLGGDRVGGHLLLAVLLVHLPRDMRVGRRELLSLDSGARLGRRLGVFAGALRAREGRRSRGKWAG